MILKLGQSMFPQLAFFIAFASAVVMARPAGARGEEGGASSLLRLISADSQVVLTIENLRGRYAEIVSSSLLEGLSQLPAVREWMQSDRYRKLVSARDKIEAFLGAPLAEIRDEILGDSVVLALQIPPETSAPTDAVRNRRDVILLVQPRNPELLRRIVRLINDAQLAGGELARCIERRRGETAYTVREHPAGSQQGDEYHVDFPDGVFAVSNSEALIQGAIDRRSGAGPGGLKNPADLREFQAVAHRLPESSAAVCRLFATRRFLERITAGLPRPADPADARALALLAGYAGAVDCAGAAFTWRDGVLTLHTAEALDPARLDPAIVQAAKDSRPIGRAPVSIPASAFAAFSAEVDLEAVYTLFTQLIPAGQRPRLANFEAALRGILLGQDLHRRILPALGPRWAGHLNAPEDSAPTPRHLSEIPLVVAVGLNETDSDAVKKPEERAEPGPDGAPPAAGSVSTADAIDNALRTTLALAAIDHKRNQGRNQVVEQEVAGVPVTTLDTPIPFAYAIDRRRRRLVMGNSARAVGRGLEADAEPDSGRRFREIRAVADPDSSARFYLGVDFRTIHHLAESRRDQLTAILAERRNRPEAEPTRDLDQVLAWIALFDSAFVTSRIEPDAAACVRRIGLISRFHVQLQSPSQSQTPRPNDRP